MSTASRIPAPMYIHACVSETWETYIVLSYCDVTEFNSRETQRSSEHVHT